MATANAAPAPRTPRNRGGWSLTAKRKEDNTQTNLTLPASVKADLDALAGFYNLSTSEVATEALKFAFSQNRDAEQARQQTKDKDSDTPRQQAASK